VAGADSNFDVELKNACVEQKDHCLNCHSPFMEVRPHIRSIVVTKRFFKDLKDKETAKAIMKDVLDCSNADFYELHKFEKHLAGCMIFRAKTEGMHSLLRGQEHEDNLHASIQKLQGIREVSRRKKEISKLITHT
jgi:hypothetical protein